MMTTAISIGLINQKLKDACSLEEKLDKPRHRVKKKRHHFANKGLYSQK